MFLGGKGVAPATGETAKLKIGAGRHCSGGAPTREKVVSLETRCDKTRPINVWASCSTGRNPAPTFSFLILTLLWRVISKKKTAGRLPAPRRSKIKRRCLLAATGQEQTRPAQGGQGQGGGFRDGHRRGLESAQRIAQHNLGNRHHRGAGLAGLRDGR